MHRVAHYRVKYKALVPNDLQHAICAWGFVFRVADNVFRFHFCKKHSVGKEASGVPARDVLCGRADVKGPWPCSYPRAKGSTHARGEQVVPVVVLPEAGVAC